MELFIEKVKLHRFLWDTNHLLYRDIPKKDLAWERIAKKCRMANGKEAKSLWKKLRDSHREAMRRRKACTGQAALRIKPWKYETIMEFILPQVENKLTSSNASNNSQGDTHNTADLNINHTDSLNTEDSDNNTDDSNMNNSDAGGPSSPPEPSSETRRFVEANRKKKGKLDSDNMCEILQHRENTREQRQCEGDDFRSRMIDIDCTTHDALSSLFNSFCQKTRELPKYLQLRVQREFFESITRAEEEAMSLEPINTYFSPSSSFASNRLPTDIVEKKVFSEI